ncbi:glycoside hydrolase family 42 protein, partial [Aureobasidium melanogenum]
MRTPAALVSLLAQVVLSATTRFTPRAYNISFAPDQDRWPGGLHLAVDYYPSQWPEYMWEPDMAAMRDASISYVRISEFDWEVLEPSEGVYNWTLLDTTLDLLGKYGLQGILGTPTAAPPNWLVEKYDVNFVDRMNQTLIFGSRRHYSFSSFDYRKLSQGITQKLAERYGNNSNIVAWQLDNEFGCHDTVRSYDHNAIIRFRTWLKEKYHTIENMNKAQGRVFWSSQYVSFDTVQPPFLNVYMPNQAQLLDWYTFSSDMVIEFAKEQAAIIRQHAPSHAITTNFMVSFTDFDHFKFNREVGLDFATFDNYPLAGVSDGAEYLRTGLPDLQAMQHALYRGIAGSAYDTNHGPFGVMEMQPGVLNWNAYRVSPLEGMVRLWTLETFAAKGDMVNYFRWRQVPYAQEQTLSGLFVSDNTPDEGFGETQIVASEDLLALRAAMSSEDTQASVAMVFDYTSVWVWNIEPYSGTYTPQDSQFENIGLAYLDVVSSFYTSLRRLGLNIDIISPEQDLSSYKMVVVPSLPIIPTTFNTALSSYNGTVIFGPHTGSRTPEFAYPPGLTPSAGTLRDKVPMKVTRVETPPSYANSGVSYLDQTYNISFWEENIICSRNNKTSNVAITSTSQHRKGKPAACEKNEFHYLAFNPPVALLVDYIGDVARAVGVKDVFGRLADKGNDLGGNLRVLERGGLVWAFNYGVGDVEAPKINGTVVLGNNSTVIEGAGVKVWKM